MMAASVYKYDSARFTSLEKWYSEVIAGKEYAQGPFGVGEVNKEIRKIKIHGNEALEVSSFIEGNQALRTFVRTKDKVLALQFMALGPDINVSDTDLYYKVRANLKIF